MIGGASSLLSITLKTWSNLSSTLQMQLPKIKRDLIAVQLATQTTKRDSWQTWLQAQHLNQEQFNIKNGKSMIEVIKLSIEMRRNR